VAREAEMKEFFHEFSFLFFFTFNYPVKYIVLSAFNSQRIVSKRSRVEVMFFSCKFVVNCL
jgi:hypothetical protein